MAIGWPQHLVDDLARRRAILFLGSGISANSVGAGGKRPPTWKQFLERALERCENPKKHISALINRGEFLTACEIIKEKLDDEWTGVLSREFTDPQYQPASVHDAIFRLDSRIVITQNFDKIYDTFALHKSTNTVHVKNYDDSDVARFIREHRRIILKPHGTIDRPQRMIFTQEQYSKALFEYAEFYSLLDALTLTNTILFLGCGLSDPDFRMMLTRHARMFPEARKHFICLSKTRSRHTDYENAIESELKLKILHYSPASGHAELTKGLEALVGLVDTRRAELARELDW